MEAPFPKLGSEASGSATDGRLGASCSPSTPVYGGVGEGLADAEVDLGTERRRRGRPRKVLATGKQKNLGDTIEEVVEIPMVEISLDRGSSLILPEACGSARALMKARRVFLIVRQLGAISHPR